MPIEKPKIRPVESFPVDQDGQTYICLRDPSGIAPTPILIGMGAYFLVTLFDGTCSKIDLQAAFTKRFGEPLPSEHLDGLIDALDQGFFLDSPAYAARMDQVREEFARNPQRPAALAGLCYEQEPVKLRREIEAFFHAPGGPGQIPQPSSDGAPLSGLIAPHIDPRRGGPAYAHAYGELLTRERPDLVIILGTSHYGRGPQLFTATRKDYMTPLGAVATDRDFVDRAGGALSRRRPLRRRTAPSQRAFDRVSGAVSGVGAGHRRLQDCADPGQLVPSRWWQWRVPAVEPRVSGFIEALRAEIAAEKRRVLIVAGVDFAHVGKKFGDSFSADAKIAEWVKDEDLALIENIKRGDPDGFFGEIAKDHDARKICGLAPMYTQLELLRGHPARLLMHDIAMEPQTESAVSFASLAID